MNQIVNKFLLTGGKFMPELHLAQLVLGKYVACGPFTKTGSRIDRFMKTVMLDNIYKNEVDKACFQHDMAYGDYKDLGRRTKLDMVLGDKAFKIANDRTKDGYQRGLAIIVYNLFDKKSKS